MNDGSCRWREAERVLCVRLDNMGDVLMTTPAMRALREQRPSRHLSLLASPAGAAVAPYIPEIDSVIRYEAPWAKGIEAAACAAPTLAADCLEMVDLLRAQRFDAAFIFTVYSQSALPAALLCMLAGIAHRIAYSRENPYALLTEWHRETEPAQWVRHEVERQLDLVSARERWPADLRLSFRVRDEDRRAAAAALAGAGVASEEEIVAVHPGASAPSRRYPAERYIAALARIAARCDARLVLTGSAGERDLCAGIRQALGAHAVDMSGLLSLGQLAALLETASVLLSNNTGPVHMAAALGTPVVDLYALTNPQHHPWRVRSRVLSFDVPCRNCYRSICPHGHQRCLTGIEPKEVADAVLAMRRAPRHTGTALEAGGALC